MFDFIKVISAAAAAAVVCGCSAVHGISWETAADEFETDYSSVYAERIIFKGMEDEQYESGLNMSVDEDVTQAVNEFDAMAQAAATEIPENIKSIFKVTQKIKRCKGDFISLIEEHYIYIGGAHGSTAWFPRNIYIGDETPHNLSLGDLFEDERYLEKINTIIKRMTEEESEKYSELWDEPIVVEETENRFYITDNDIVIFFPPYTLSYYAKGFIEYPIKLTEIEGLLKPEYKGALIGGEA